MNRIIVLILMTLLSLGCAKTMMKNTWSDPVKDPDGVWKVFPEKMLVMQRTWGDSWASIEPSTTCEAGTTVPSIFTSGGTLSENGVVAIKYGVEVTEEAVAAYLSGGASKGLDLLKKVSEKNDGE